MVIVAGSTYCVTFERARQTGVLFSDILLIFWCNRMSWDSRYGSAVVGSDAINEEFAWIGRMCGADKASSNSVGSLGEYTNDYFANVFCHSTQLTIRMELLVAILGE